MAALSADYVNARKIITRLLSKDEVFSKTGISEMTHEERIARSRKMSEKVVPLFLESGLDFKFVDVIIDILGEPLPIMMHYSMFLHTLQTQCTPEQRDVWIHKCFNGEVIGVYAQTELGWGSDTSSLETTAVRGENGWIIDSPTLRSIKVWPGGAASPSTTHALVVAKYEGTLRMFIVPLASKGVSRGSVGRLMGFHTAANGWLRFRNVKIPLDFALPEVTKSVLYGTMVHTRGRIIRSSFFSLAKALTIAHGYARFREQPRGVLIMKHPHVFATLLKWTSFAECLGHFDASLCANEIAMKAYITDNVALGIEECRRICGGYGYACHSMFPELYTTFVASVTYEGSNEMLYEMSGKANGTTLIETKQRCEELLRSSSSDSRGVWKRMAAFRANGISGDLDKLSARISSFGITQYEHNSSLVAPTAAQLYSQIWEHLQTTASL